MWCRSMKVALISKNKCDRASLVWKSVENWFSQGDIFRIADIQEEVARLQQGTLDISSYFTKLMTLWEEIETFRPIRDCTCAIPCSCGAAADLRKFKEQDKVIKFLKGLGDQYSHVGSQIMLMSPLPTLDNAFNLILQQERLFNLHSTTDSSFENQSSVNYSSQTPSRSSHNSSRGRGRGNRLCTHCGRTNHTIETCFIEHGYPPGFQHRKQHLSSPAGNASVVNSIQDAGSAPISSSSSASTSTNGSSASLSKIQEQYTQILQLLQQSNLQSHSPSSVNSLFAINFVSHTSPSPSSGNNLSKPQGDNNSQWWIIDTGSTDHITHIFDSYFSTYHIAPKSMTMPNGDTVTTTIAGSVLLYDSLVLHNVYYFPSFHVNIISVTTLFDSTLYDVKLFPNFCKIVQLHHPKMTGFTARRGIIHHRSCVETPQQNGIVERKHQHILNVARALSFHSHLPHNLWHLSIQQAIHIINRLPTPLLNNLTPYQMLHSTPPILNHLKVFGCLAYSSTLHNNRTKFAPRARKSIFLGYREGTKGYLLYDPLTHEFYVSRNVTFHETTFPFASPPPENNSVSINPNTNTIDIFDILTDIPPSLTSPNELTSPPSLHNLPPPTHDITSSPSPHQLPPSPHDIISPTSPPIPTRKSNRLTKPPAYLSEYHCNLLSSMLPASNPGDDL
ncbi:hypothetical protein KIW84_041663 [Lathyrus oleraceus]|uniref:Integrase catalytic domain-containing protein n=1 Tax=Pisum sativum TaxID=3888 RepID=A0A9D5ARY3_PEA|nr:hypothetical protein KIW84_041663 [Pisum sativum]